MLCATRTTLKFKMFAIVELCTELIAVDKSFGLLISQDNVEFSMSCMYAIESGSLVAVTYNTRVYVVYACVPYCHRIERMNVSNGNRTNNRNNCKL